MKILYYCWEEVCSEDILDAFKRKGHSVDVFDMPITDKLNDLPFAEAFLEKVTQDNYDFVFSFNFYPIISKVTNAAEIKYVSWCFDSPCMTLYADAIFNSCNYIFVFDKLSFLQLQSMGVNNIYHMPLAVNTFRLDKMFNECINTTNYTYDVSFIGRTYNDGTNFYDQIKNIPDYYRGFFDGIIRAQMDLFGCDIASGIFTNDFVKNLGFVSFNISDELMLDSGDMFTQIFQKKITSVERPEILKMIADDDISVYHFAPPDDILIDNVKKMSYVDYNEEMPQIFRNSKINLNITLRSILSGIPLRCLDIMGAGGFLLSNYQPELAEFFTDGKDMVMYTSRQDLLDKIHYYLSHDEERIAIATNGRQKIRNNFSYDIIIDEILDIVFKSNT